MRLNEKEGSFSLEREAVGHEMPERETLKYETLERKALTHETPKRKALERGWNIRLAALDMDDTLLRRNGTLSHQNRSALICALEAGIQVVPASGRALFAMPDEVLSISGIEYAVTSNGARVTELKTGKTLYQNGLSARAVEAMLPLLSREDRIIEAFVDGKAYAPQNYVLNPAAFGVTEHQVSYIRETRIPVEDILSFLRQSIDQVEGINCIYESRERKEADRRIFSSSCPEVTVTSSMVYNLELIGKTTSKEDGLAHLCAVLKISPKQVMACGDSGNDVGMFGFAGVSVAMRNAAEEIRQAAEFTTLSNDEDGVAAAFQQFIFDPQGIPFSWKGDKNA